jgi:hypothetical protein
MFEAIMRTAELILVQPDGKIKRTLVTSVDDGLTSEQIEQDNRSMIRGVLDHMLYDDGWSRIEALPEEDAQRLKAVLTDWQPPQR